MKKSDPALLKEIQIKEALDTFPEKGSWKIFECSRLAGHRKQKKKWKALGLQETEGGNYAFLLPERFFLVWRIIPLHGPQRNSRTQKIPFRFRPIPIHCGKLKWVVLYVGKTSKLKQRFQWHFSARDGNGGAQMLHNLSQCNIKGIGKSRKRAVQFLLDHGVIVYRILSRPQQAANREMIEVNLWAKYSPPFNIKSER